MNSRIACVTGGGSGLGEAISHRFARDGLVVAILDINEANAKACAHAINAAGGIAAAFHVDIANRASVEAAVAAVRQSLGPITVLVNNAGVFPFRPFVDITDAEWDAPMAVNLKGTFIVTQTVIPDMAEARWGRIVNISSSSAQIGAENMVHYSASKGGVIAMSKSLARELGPSGITVNNVAPSFVVTGATFEAEASGHLPASIEQIRMVAPVRRGGVPDDIAAACAYLVSEEAGYVTGQTFGVNGGRVIT